MLEIKNLKASLAEEGNTILDGIDLQINVNEVHVLLGPNGSGKSSLGRVLMGDEKFDVSGKVEFEGENVLEMETDERARAGMFLAFQSPPEIDGINAKELLLAAKKVQNEDERVSGFKFEKELQEKMFAVGLGGQFITREMHKGASGGEKRKMEMVSLQVLQPKFAFLDEIDSGVDVDGLKAIGESVKQFMELPNRSLVIVSHAEPILAYLPITHVHILINGKIVKSGGKELIEQVHSTGFGSFKKKKGGLKVKSR